MTETKQNLSVKGLMKNPNQLHACMSICVETEAQGVLGMG